MTATEVPEGMVALRERAALFAFEQRDDNKPDGWNEACDHIAHGFRHEANPFGLNTWVSATPDPEHTRLRELNARLVEGLRPFAKAAATLSAVAPDGLDDGLAVLAYIHAKPANETVFSTADFNRAATLLAEVDQAHG